MRKALALVTVSLALVGCGTSQKAPEPHTGRDLDTGTNCTEDMPCWIEREGWGCEWVGGAEELATYTTDEVAVYICTPPR